MATSVLSQNHLLFKDASQIDQVKLTTPRGNMGRFLKITKMDISQ